MATLYESIALTTFESLGLTPSILTTLQSLGYSEPTPIQAKAIPVMMQGGDLLGLAQTGTGKTAAFGLPLIDRLQRTQMLAQPGEVRALILAPTRELATQIASSLRDLSKRSPLKIVMVTGGQSVHMQTQRMAKGADILIATPGRLLDHAKRRSVNLSKVKHFILDEADQMLDLGFIKDLRRIAKLVPAERQTAMFSATMPDDIAALARDFLKNPERVAVTPPGKTADKITQCVVSIDKRDKPSQLRAQLTKLGTPHAMVFARTKHGADKLSRELAKHGFANAAIHGNKSQGQRTRALESFKAGKIHVLVATDVAARGIDIPGVTHVFNYDLPEVPDVYVHRIGRTARAGAEGAAIAFCSPDEQKLLRAIGKLTNIRIPAGETLAAGAGDTAPAWFADKREHADIPAERGNANGGQRDGRKSRANRKPHRKGPSARAHGDNAQGSSGQGRNAHGDNPASAPTAMPRTKPRKAFRGRKPGQRQAA